MSQPSTNTHQTGGSGNDEDSFVTSCIQAQSFAEYLCGPDSDTDAENSTVPQGRQWVWYCKLPACPRYYRPWSLKSNFMLHLYETPAHQNDSTTRTREGRRRLAESWREETDYGLTEPVKKPPPGWPPAAPVNNDPDITEDLMRQAGRDSQLAAMLTTRTLEETNAQEQSGGQGNEPT